MASHLSYEHAVAHAQVVAKLGEHAYYRYVQSPQSIMPLSAEGILALIDQWEHLDVRFQRYLAPVIAFAATQFPTVQSRAVGRHVLLLLSNNPVALAYVASAYDTLEPHVPSWILEWVRRSFLGYTAWRAFDYIVRIPYLARHAHAALRLLYQSKAISEVDWRYARVFLRLFVDTVVALAPSPEHNANSQEQGLLDALQTLHNLIQRDTQSQSHKPLARALSFFSSLHGPNYFVKMRAEHLARYIQKENLTPFVPVTALRYLVSSSELSPSLSLACAKAWQWSPVPRSPYEWLEALVENLATREWARRWVMLQLETAQTGQLCPVLLPAGSVSQRAVLAITKAMLSVDVDKLTPQGLMAAHSVILRLSAHSNERVAQELENCWNRAYQFFVENEFLKAVSARNNLPATDIFQSI